MQPNPRADTSSPLLPNVRVCIALLPIDQGLTMTLIDSRSFGPKQDRCAHSSSIGRERGFCKQDTCRALPLAGVHRQLRGESALVSGARFAARDVGGQVRELIKQARRL